MCFDTDLITGARPANHEGARMIQLYVVPWHRLSKQCVQDIKIVGCGLGFTEEKALPISISDHDLRFDVIESCIHFGET